MIAWVLLGGAIVTEVAAALSLRMASRGKNRWWWVAVAVGYVFAFALLSGTLSTGMSLGVAYRDLGRGRRRADGRAQSLPL